MPERASGDADGWDVYDMAATVSDTETDAAGTAGLYVLVRRGAWARVTTGRFRHALVSHSIFFRNKHRRF